MALLCFCRAFKFSSVGMSGYSNIRKFVGYSHAAILRPIKVNQSKFNLNLILKRDFIRPSKDLLRLQDSDLKGFELIYKEQHASLFYLMLGGFYAGVAGIAWKMVDMYILGNQEALQDKSEHISIHDKYVHTKYDKPLAFVACIGFALVLCKLSLRTPLRIYRKNDEIVAVFCSYLGPFKKRIIYCSISDIKPMADNPLIPFREQKVNIKGKEYYFFDHNFKTAADVNQIRNKEKLRTRLDDVMDEVQRWIDKYVTKKGK